MCNGFSTRTSQGGSIAVLRPSGCLEEFDTSEKWYLLFSNPSECGSGMETQVDFRGPQESQKISKGNYWVVIHRNGDVRASTSTSPPYRIPLNPFFTFSLPKGSTSVAILSQQLDLGVGEAGIIGRKVSLMTSSMKGPQAVAEGIIGWN